MFHSQSALTCNRGKLNDLRIYPANGEDLYEWKKTIPNGILITQNSCLPTPSINLLIERKTRTARV